jgi:hypothetical protein
MISLNRDSDTTTNKLKKKEQKIVYFKKISILESNKLHMIRRGALILLISTELKLYCKTDSTKF